MRLRRSSKTTAAAVVAWAAVALVLVAGAAGLTLPARAVTLVWAAVLAASLAASVRTLLGAWRGPVISSFPRRDAVLCDPPGSEAIRMGAQLRGTMGGAGHVHPARLAFPAAAWAAAAAIAATVLRDASLGFAPPWPLGVLGAAAAAALLLPARPFFYREVTGGRVLVFPAAACTRLLENAAATRALETVEPRGASESPPPGWVSSRNPLETRGNCPQVDSADQP
jgi:hypothetical protein